MKRLLIPLLGCVLFTLGLLQACTTAGIAPLSTNERGRLSGRVFFDENANQDCDDCECGIADVSIRLYADSCGGALMQIIKTDAQGYFEFTNVESGAYCVYADLFPTCEGYLPTTSISQKVELGRGEHIELEGFGYDLYIDALKK